MALIKCPDCGKDISTLAKNCPSCGRPMKNNEELEYENDKLSGDFITQKLITIFLILSCVIISSCGKDSEIEILDTAEIIELSKRLAAAAFHTCAIKTDDTLYCWGDNRTGKLGIGTTAKSNFDNSAKRVIPMKLNGLWKRVSSRELSCGIKQDDTLWCWGQNNYGQVGNGTSGDSKDAFSNIQPEPVMLGNEKWNYVSAGVYHGCGIKSDKSLWCWGLIEPYDRFDDKTNIDFTMPNKIGGDKWNLVSSGNVHTCGIKSDGTLECWGDNEYGQLGNNSLVEKWLWVSAGNRHTCGIKNDGSLWCWGRNNYGQPGDGKKNDSNVPVRVGEDKWKMVEAGQELTCGIMTNNTLWCWGRNRFGLIGIESESSLIPNKIGEYTWKTVSLAAFHICGIRNNNSLWCWGRNSFGQLGDATIIDRQEPVKIW